MQGWFRRWVKRWLEGPPEPVLEALVGGEIRRVVPHAICGLGLLCNVPTSEGMSQQMILHTHAVDQQHFWRLWKSMGGSEMKLWADGKPFKPGI